MNLKLNSKIEVISLLISTAFLIVPFHGVEASEDVNITDLASLRAPTSPAFVMLGVAPTSIEKPTTPAGIGLALLNNSEGLTSLPKDFAMEFSPYWLTSHNEFNWSGDTARNPVASIQRTASISIATANLGDGETDITGISVGFRGSIFSGTMTESSKKQLREMEVVLGEFAALLLNDANYQLLVAKDRDNKRNGIDSRYAEEYMNKLSEKGKVAELDDFTPEREGFFWEIAGGTLWSVPDNNARMGKNRGWGLWNTFRYSHDKANFLAVLRYLDNELISVNNVFDWGMRLLIEGKLLSISAEYLKRNFSDDDGRDPQERYVGLIEYRLSPALGVNFSFGQDFGTGADGSFVSQLGLSLGVNPVK